MDGSLARKYNDSDAGVDRQSSVAISNAGGSKNIQVYRGNMRWFDLRLGPLQITALFGAMMGFVAGAFYLGFHSGRTVGFDMARGASSADVAKLPIPESLIEKESPLVEPSADQIYDRLNQNAGFGSAPLGDSSHSPSVNVSKPDKKNKADTKTLGVVSKEQGLQLDPKSDVQKTQNTANKGKLPSAPSRDQIGGEFSKVAPAEDLHKDPVVEDLAPEKSQGSVRVLGESADQKTLGALLDERLKEVRESNPVEKPSQPTAPEVLPSSEKKDTIAKEKVVDPKKANPPVTEVAKKEEKPKSESKETIRGVLPSGWFAQVAAPKKISEAQDIAKRLRGSGFKVLIENAHVRGEDYFRVVVGPEESKVQADRLVQQLKRESYISGAPFVRNNR